MGRPKIPRCKICGKKQELARKGNDAQFDIHECKPKGCPIASQKHTLANGTPCPDKRHTLH